MTSTWKHMPERSSTVEPGPMGEFTHSSRWSWWPGFRKMPKNGSPRCLPHDLVERAAGDADADRGVPLGDRGEVGRHEAIHVVADGGRELIGRLDHEAGSARERAPDAEGHGEAIASLDRAIARAQQPERGPWPGAEHEVAGQRPAVPAEQADGLPLGHPGLAGRRAAVARPPRSGSWPTRMPQAAPAR